MNNEYSYKIADSLFQSLKEFIVLGLCGRTGSGCSSVSEILKQQFSQLKLPKPAEEPGGSAQLSEDLILYNYAKANWKPFYQIKVSRLMIGYLLTGCSENEFSEYLKNMSDRISDADQEMIQKAFHDFYNAKMKFIMPEYVIKRIMADFPGGHDDLAWPDILEHLGCFMEEANSWDLLFPQEKDENWPETGKIKEQFYKEAPYRLQHPVKCFYEYQYEKENHKCIFGFRLCDMQKILEEYAFFRKSRRTKWNSMLYWILYEYAYHALPEFAKEFLDKVGKAQRGLPTMILQDIGINLRTWGKPLVYDLKKQNVVFQDDGFLTIIRRVNLYLKVLQDYLQKQKEFGDRLRSHIADNKELQNNAASAYAKCLKLLEQETGQVVVAIDSIKNPFESTYLKARYSSYYLMAIYTDETERYRRLQKSQKGLTLDEIRTIDTIEQLKEFKKIVQHAGKNKIQEEEDSMLSKAVLGQLADKLKRKDLFSILPFITQNVEQCVESADIFINNHEDNRQCLSLKKKLVRYICLIMNPGLVLPTPIERCMQMAQAAKACSGCISRQVGAVLTDHEYQIRSIGWNDVPNNRVPCIYRDMQEVKQHWNPQAYSDFENDDNDEFQKYIRHDDRIEQAGEMMRKKGKRIPFCFKDVYNAKTGNKNQVHPRALHAEERAFLSLPDQGGVSIKGGYLFTTSSPCELCTKKLCFFGISKVYYVEPYSGISFKHIMSDGPKEQRPVQELFTGALGRAYTYLYTPVLSKKDELELWLGYKLDGMPPADNKKADSDLQRQDQSGTEGELHETGDIEEKQISARACSKDHAASDAGRDPRER